MLLALTTVRNSSDLLNMFQDTVHAEMGQSFDEQLIRAFYLRIAEGCVRTYAKFTKKKDHDEKSATSLNHVSFRNKAACGISDLDSNDLKKKKKKKLFNEKKRTSAAMLLEISPLPPNVSRATPPATNAPTDISSTSDTARPASSTPAAESPIEPGQSPWLRRA